MAPLSHVGLTELENLNCKHRDTASTIHRRATASLIGVSFMLDIEGQ
jgi:hypothetical protein